MRTLITLACAAMAAAHSKTYTAEEFALQGHSSPDAIVTFSAAMPWRNFEKLDAELAEISNPKSARYGQWMTQEQVNELTAPAPEVRAEVAAFMAAKGATCEDYPHSLRCSAPVSAMEAMLKTKFSAFKQTTRNGRMVHRIHPEQSFEYPMELEGKLSFISNLVDFPTVRRRNGKVHAFDSAKAAKTLRAGRAQATDFIVVIETLKDMYDITGLTPSIKSTQAPAEFQNDTSYNKADLKMMAQQSGVADWNVTKTVGPYDGSDPDLEASLDEQYIGGVGHGNDNWYWTEEDWQYEFVEALAKAKDGEIPNVFSISWGWSEADQCTIDPTGPCTSGSSAAYVTATNAGFAAAGARGVSFLISSGDSGAHGRTDPDCATPKTLPDWPTASPYITAVGATQLGADAAKGTTTSPICKTPPSGYECATSGSEIVCSTATNALIVSGGGFSNVAAQPAWQTAAVAAYLKSGATLPPAGDYNKTSRGYPDVSALGHNYVIWATGQSMLVDGTSCSAPVWGGIIGLANAARLAAGKKVLGFLNPAIYQIAAADPTVFHDVTKGDNKCTEDGCAAGCTGYEAAKGWDAATGWGTPDVAKFVAAAAALP